MLEQAWIINLSLEAPICNNILSRALLAKSIENESLGSLLVCKLEGNEDDLLDFRAPCASSHN